MVISALSLTTDCVIQPSLSWMVVLLAHMAKVYSMTKCDNIKYVDDKEVVYFYNDRYNSELYCQTKDKAIFIVNFLTSLCLYQEGEWKGTAAAPFFEKVDSGLYRIEFLDEEWEIFKENLGLFDIVLEEMKDG
jgi:hypothetical protein